MTISMSNYPDNNEISDSEYLVRLLYWRDSELTNSDWTQLPNGPLDSTTVTAWATYRQDLRDLTAQNVAPRLIVIPVRPI